MAQQSLKLFNEIVAKERASHICEGNVKSGRSFRPSLRTA